MKARIKHFSDIPDKYKCCDRMCRNLHLIDGLAVEIQNPEVVLFECPCGDSFTEHSYTAFFRDSRGSEVPVGCLDIFKELI